MTNSADILERYRQVMFPAAAPYHGDNPLVADRAKDQYIWDVDGTRYLDFFGGILTVSVGHCNDEITERAMEQLRTLQHTSTIYVNEVMVRLAEKVAALTPGRLQKCYFTNSGTEANETAVLAARMYTGNPVVITLRHAYSGRSMLAMSLSAQQPWRLGGVVDPYIKHVRNPYTFRAPDGMTPEQVVDLCVQDLEETIATGTEGRIAAFMAEPIQGAGGFIVPPEDYFRRIMPIVKAAGGIFISDEVQTGWGRTGDKWFGIEHWGVEPDIMTFAKGMGNGSPIGCTIATPEVADAIQGLDLLHLRRQSGHDGDHAGHRRIHGSPRCPDQRRRARRAHARETGGIRGRVRHHRRGARHGIDAGDRIRPAGHNRSGCPAHGGLR